MPISPWTSMRLSFRWFPPWNSCFEACRLRVIADVFPGWIPYFEASNLKTLAEAVLQINSLNTVSMFKHRFTSLNSGFARLKQGLIR